MTSLAKVPLTLRTELLRLRADNSRLLEEREFVVRDTETPLAEGEARYLRRSLRTEVLRRQRAEEELQRARNTMARAVQMVDVLTEADDCAVTRSTVLGWLRSLLAEH